MPWINEVEMSNTVDDLETSQQISGRQSPNFETLFCDDLHSTEEQYPEFELQE